MMNAEMSNKRRTDSLLVRFSGNRAYLSTVKGRVVKAVEYRAIAPVAPSTTNRGSDVA